MQEIDKFLTFLYEHVAHKDIVFAFIIYFAIFWVVVYLATRFIEGVGHNITRYLKRKRKIRLSRYVLVPAEVQSFDLKADIRKNEEFNRQFNHDLSVEWSEEKLH